MAELKKAGAHYKIVVAQDEFAGELPVDVDGSDATGTGPLAGFGADFDASLTMRDVILVRKGSKVKLGATAQAHYVTRFEPNVGGLPIPVDRGWVSVEARVGAFDFRFVNTHLEAFGDPNIRAAQAFELAAGPLNTRKQVVLVGDLNSGVARHNEPEQPGDDLAFRVLEIFGMTDNGAVQSCCYSDLFDATQVFDHTVDHVLTKPGLETKQAFVTGDDVSERTPSGLWPSDHGGVVSRLQLRK
jgi:Endonuclease/Exonuclease/phosphatase family